MIVRLVCGNCGRIERFDSWEAAFTAGWDTVERFGYTACDRCPGVSVYFPMLYAHQAREAATPEEREALLAKAADATVRFEGVDFSSDESAMRALLDLAKQKRPEQ